MTTAHVHCLSHLPTAHEPPHDPVRAAATAAGRAADERREAPAGRPEPLRRPATWVIPMSRDDRNDSRPAS
jgi:hypothetical protein